METLFERHLEYLSDVPTSFERELMKTIDWDSRLILIRGPKGVGKSTLMLQYILKNYGVSDRHVLYCSADTGYFTTHTLVDTAAAFVRQGGTHLFIDEIHKYDGWSKQIKEIYDLFKHLSDRYFGVKNLIVGTDDEAVLLCAIDDEPIGVFGNGSKVGRIWHRGSSMLGGEGDRLIVGSGIGIALSRNKQVVLCVGRKTCDKELLVG